MVSHKRFTRPCSGNGVGYQIEHVERMDGSRSDENHVRHYSLKRSQYASDNKDDEATLYKT
jgi:hypothetical protein